MDFLVSLSDLKNSLSSCHVKLNLNFLNKLLKDASKTETPHKNKYFAKRISCPINKNKNLSTTIYGWMKGYRTIPFLKLITLIELSSYSWEDINKNLISIKAGIRNGEISPNFPINIDYKLGSIIGHILGDGSIDKRLHSVFYSNSNKELLLEFSRFMKYLFGIEPRIWVQDFSNYGNTHWLKRVDNLNKVPCGHNVGLFYPKICADILYAIMGTFAEGSNKTITNQMKESNLEFKKGLIRAFFDDEGSVSSINYSIRFHQDRKDILEDLIIILKELNINSNPVRSYDKRNKTRYYFNITSFKEYSSFYKIIGCTSSKKREELIVLIDKVRKSKSRI